MPAHEAPSEPNDPKYSGYVEALDHMLPEELKALLRARCAHPESIAETDRTALLTHLQQTNLWTHGRVDAVLALTWPRRDALGEQEWKLFFRAVKWNLEKYRPREGRDLGNASNLAKILLQVEGDDLINDQLFYYVRSAKSGGYKHSNGLWNDFERRIVTRIRYYRAHKDVWHQIFGSEPPWEPPPSEEAQATEESETGGEVEPPGGTDSPDGDDEGDGSDANGSEGDVDSDSPAALRRLFGSTREITDAAHWLLVGEDEWLEIVEQLPVGANFHHRKIPQLMLFLRLVLKVHLFPETPAQKATVQTLAQRMHLNSYANYVQKIGITGGYASHGLNANTVFACWLRRHLVDPNEVEDLDTAKDFALLALREAVRGLPAEFLAVSPIAYLRSSR